MCGRGGCRCSMRRVRGCLGFRVYSWGGAETDSGAFGRGPRKASCRKVWARHTYLKCMMLVYSPAGRHTGAEGTVGPKRRLGQHNDHLDMVESCLAKTA